MLLVELNTNKKKQIYETTSQLKFNTDSNSKEYKIEGINDSTVYVKELKNHL